MSVLPLVKVERLRHPGGPFGVESDGAGHVSDGEDVFAHGDLSGVAVGVDVVVFGYGGVVFDVGDSVRGGDDDAGVGFPQRDGGPLVDARPAVFQFRPGVFGEQAGVEVGRQYGGRADVEVVGDGGADGGAEGLWLYPTHKFSKVRSSNEGVVGAGEFVQGGLGEGIEKPGAAAGHQGWDRVVGNVGEGEITQGGGEQLRISAQVAEV